MSTPITLIRNNGSEKLRVFVGDFKGHQLVNRRIWSRADDGRMWSGNQGLALRLGLLPALRAAPEHAAASSHDDRRPHHCGGARVPRNSPAQPPEQVDWRDRAAKAMLPVFPISIYRDKAGKWCKVPLIKGGHAHYDASFDVAKFDPRWPEASGYGVPMGEVAKGVAYYCLDLDLDKPDYAGDEWLRRWQVPRETRTIRTISSGLHLIYSLPAAHATLPSRGNVVPGLDTRGFGGWCAFGMGYELVLDVAPVLLPSTVCIELQARWKGGVAVGSVELLDFEGVDGPAVFHKLKRTLWWRRRFSLDAVWHGRRKPKVGSDTTRSGNDHCAAFQLAYAAFTAPEIAYLLLHRYKHGVAADAGDTPETRRKVGRCAAKAAQHVEAVRAAGRQDPPQHTPEAAEEYLAMIKAQEDHGA